MSKLTTSNQKKDEIDFHLVAILIRAELRNPTHLHEDHTIDLVMTLHTVERLIDSGVTQISAI